MSKSLITAILAVLFSVYSVWVNCKNLESTDKVVECMAKHLTTGSNN